MLLDHFSNIKRLILHSIRGKLHGERMKKLLNLTELQLHSMIVTEKDIKEMMNGLQLRKLVLLSCQELPSKAFDYISLQKDIESLDIYSGTKD